MVLKVNDSQVLIGSAEDFTDFSKTGKMLLDHVLFVKAWRNIPAHDGGEIAGRQPAETVQAVPACSLADGGRRFGH